MKDIRSHFCLEEAETSSVSRQEGPLAEEEWKMVSGLVCPDGELSGQRVGATA